MGSSQMADLVPILILLVVTSITPGPNNFIVMSLASRSGVGSALPAIGGVLIGCMSLFVLSWIGVSGVVMTNPSARSLLAVSGAIYLMWTGIVLFRSRGGTSRLAGTHPQSLMGLALFQLSNPKAWFLVTAISAAATKDSETGPNAALVGGLFIVSCTTSLLLWAIVGHSISNFLASPKRRAGFNRVMGVLLIGTAPMMFL